MSNPETNTGLLAALSQVVELPKNLLSLDLHMAVGEVPTVRCTFHPERAALGDPLVITTLYRLEEIPAEQTLPDDKASP